jgi:hypothetical protein
MICRELPELPDKTKYFWKAVGSPAARLDLRNPMGEISVVGTFSLLLSSRTKWGTWFFAGGGKKLGSSLRSE